MGSEKGYLVTPTLRDVLEKKPKKKKKDWEGAGQWSREKIRKSEVFQKLEKEVFQEGEGSQLYEMLL